MAKATLKYTINLQGGMAVTAIRVDESKKDKDEVDATNTSQDANIIKGEIEFNKVSNTVSVSILGVGNQPNRTGTCNFTFNSKKLYESDKEFTVNSKGRFRFYDGKVKLPQ